MNLLTSISNPIKYNSASSSQSLGVTPIIYYTCINTDIDTNNKKIKNYATGNYDLTYNNNAFISNITNTNFDSSTRGCFYSSPTVYATGTLSNGYTFSGSPNSVSFCFWIKLNALTPRGYYPFSFGNYQGILFQLDYNTTSGYITGGFVYCGNTTFQFNGGYATDIRNWTHICVTFKSSSNPKLYVNGTLAVTSSNANPLNSSFTTPSYFEIVGKPDGNSRLTTYINELRFYNVELSATQITTLYNWNGVGTL